MKTKELIDLHWAYINDVLMIHNVQAYDRKIAETAYKTGMDRGLAGLKKKHRSWGSNTMEFHYHTAYEHGKKHRDALEVATRKETS